MTVSLAGFERVSVKIRLVVPELPSTTAASFASSKGRVCAGAIRFTRQNSSRRPIRRVLRFREKLGAATIPNTVRVNNESARLLQFFSTQCPHGVRTVAQKEKTPLTRGSPKINRLFFAAEANQTGESCEAEQRQGRRFGDGGIGAKGSLQKRIPTLA